MGIQVSFGFGNFRLILRAPEAHTTGGGTDEGQLTEAVVKDSQGTVLGHRVFHDVFDLVAQLCPGAVPVEHPAERANCPPTSEDRGGLNLAAVQKGTGGHPVLVIDSLNLRDAEIALVRDAVKHAETLAAAAAVLGISVPQLRSKARQLRIALPFAVGKGRRS